MQVSGRAIVISAAVFFSAIGIYVSSSSPSETVVSDSRSTTLTKRCFEEYCIGDTGPGGGTIVYVGEAGFWFGASCSKFTCHVLEMAPADLVGQYSWRSAVAAAEAFSTPSRDDWVLPSIWELYEMCKYAFDEPAAVAAEGGGTRCKNNENGTDATGLRFGGFSTDYYYWSSSEYEDGTAYVYAFWSGYEQGANIKYRLGNVRPVRAF
jgi:hypothetical protein